MRCIDMENSNITIRIDKQLKQQAESTFADMGMNMTTAITIFLKTVVCEKRIPFDICLTGFQSKENQKILHESIKQLEKGNGTNHELIDEDK